MDLKAFFCVVPIRLVRLLGMVAIMGGFQKKIAHPSSVHGLVFKPKVQIDEKRVSNLIKKKIILETPETSEKKKFWHENPPDRAHF